LGYLQLIGETKGMTMQETEFNAGLLEFLGEATSPFHAVKVITSHLAAAGYQPLSETVAWDCQPGGKYYLIKNDSSIVAFKWGTDSSPVAGMRMVGAHTDSPCLMVKPNPEKKAKGYTQLGVEVYGGALLNPWFDRDLSLAGRVSFIDDKGALRKQLLDFRSPLAVIPSLAIHLDREANQSRSINAQTDIVPLLCTGEQLDLRELLVQRLAEEHPTLTVARMLDYELCFYDTQAPALTGLHQEFISSARLDNLLSCYAGLQALLSSDDAMSCLLICNDHEEVGSQSTAGAQGPLLKTTLERIAGDAQTYSTMIEHSLMISADNAHAVHPNFASKHDDNHGPMLNKGPVIKVNSNQRYATNSETSALFRQVCAAIDIPVQSFVVRTDMGCGSTIGPLTAGGIGVRTLDVGAPQFAMHSIRELAGSKDACYLAQALAGFMSWNRPLSPQSM
jgi:aspartyl aminopeptidase